MGNYEGFLSTVVGLKGKLQGGDARTGESIVDKLQGGDESTGESTVDKLQGDARTDKSIIP